MYILQDGTEVTADQIRQAFDEGRAVAIYSRGENKIVSSLMLDGVHFDTRGQCYSMWEEAWTKRPATLVEALLVAGY